MGIFLFCDNKFNDVIVISCPSVCVVNKIKHVWYNMPLMDVHVESFSINECMVPSEVLERVMHAY